MKRISLKETVLVGCCILFIASCFGCNFIRVDELNQAVARGDKQAVIGKIAKGVDVNGRGMHAMTPLMVAAKTGRADICKLLIEKGADANAHNDSGSVLMWAVHSRNEEIVRLVLNAGAHTSWTNALGESAESFARNLTLTNIAETIHEHQE